LIEIVNTIIGIWLLDTDHSALGEKEVSSAVADTTSNDSSDTCNEYKSRDNYNKVYPPICPNTVTTTVVRN
jgi:hypothetical protein